jgi:tripartite-type tricarboxylate transporter receptor subunit TctC
VITDQRLGRAEHKRFVEAEINKWGPVIRAAGQYAD